MSDLELPTCAVCQKPVDRLLDYREDRRLCHVFIALCHGQAERIEVADYDLRDMGMRLHVGTAFKNPVPATPDDWAALNQHRVLT